MHRFFNREKNKKRELSDEEKKAVAKTENILMGFPVPSPDTNKDKNEIKEK